MKIFCKNCNKEQIVAIQPSGPHMKGVCSICTSYIKHLSKEEIKEVLDEEEEEEKDAVTQCLQRVSKLEKDILNLKEVVDKLSHAITLYHGKLY